MPKYNEINWDQAECRESYTDLFYDLEEERNQAAYRHINALRSICGRCPIQRECLDYAFQHEEYGTWGGLTGLERRSIGQPARYPIPLRRALQALRSFGITYKEVKESYEHSLDVRGLENRSPNS